MSATWKKAWKCDLCGHSWLATTADPPPQCAKCRRRGWNTGNDYTHDAAPEPLGPRPAPAPEPVPVAQSLEELKAKFNLRPLSELQPPPERTLDTFETQDDQPITPADRGYHALFRKKYGRIPNSQDELNSFKAQRLEPRGRNNP